MDDDKARRNLVMVSSGILLTGWLNLPLTDIAEKVLGIKHSGAIDPGRAWLAVMAVLLYLAYRFTFSEDAEKAQAAWRADWETQLRRWQHWQLVRHMKRAAAGKADSVLFGNELLAIFDREDEVNRVNRKSGGVIRLATDARVVDHQSRWSGKVSLSWDGVRPNGSTVGASGRTAQYEYRRLRDRLPIALAAVFVVVARSKTSSVAVFPAVLGSLAMGMASYRWGLTLTG